MDQPKTILVLGAGSSVPYGLPTGPKLKDNIWQSMMYSLNGASMTGCIDLHSILTECGFSRDQQEAFSSALQMSPQYSVDAFLERQPTFLDIGRTAIAATLDPLERSCADSHLGHHIDGDWYRYLYNALGSSIEELSSIRLGVISFNYDRSFWWYLCQAVMSDFGITLSEAEGVLSGISIVHVYGRLGPHPIGAAPEAVDLAAAAQQIEIMAHSGDATDALKAAQALVLQAKRLYFLGFGFHPLNVQRLSIFNEWPADTMGHAHGIPRPSSKTVHGTTLGMTAAEIGRAKSLFSVPVYFEQTSSDWDCHAFLKETDALDHILHDG